jgi:hypothetical protein
MTNPLTECLSCGAITLEGTDPKFIGDGVVFPAHSCPPVSALPCVECAALVPADIHGEELGLCLSCSNDYWGHLGKWQDTPVAYRGPANPRRLTIATMLGLSRTPSAYSVTVVALILASVAAASLDTPTAYLVPLAATAWAVALWGYRRETSARYKRNR